MRKKIVLGLLAGLLLAPSSAPAASLVWETYAHPTTLYDRTKKIIYGSILGALSGGCLGGLAQYQKQQLACFLALCISRASFGMFPNVRSVAGMGVIVGGIIGGVLGKRSADNNAPDVWFAQFSDAMRQTAASPFVNDGGDWNRGYDMASVVDAERLQGDLRLFLDSITRLNGVAKILLKLEGWLEFQQQALAGWAQQLVVWYELSSRRLLVVSAIVDTRVFNAGFENVVGERVLSHEGDPEAWRRTSDGQVRSYKDLMGSLERVMTHLQRATSAAQRLLSEDCRTIISPQDREDVVRRLAVLKERDGICAERTSFVGARVEWEKFNVSYNRLATVPELNVQTAVEETAWLPAEALTRSGEISDLSGIAARLSDMHDQLLHLKAQGTELLSLGRVLQLSSLERDALVARMTSLNDLYSVCQERQQVVRGLQKLEVFTRKQRALLRSHLVRASSRGAHDLSWMEMPRSTEWPLQKLHQQLEAKRKELRELLDTVDGLATDGDVLKTSQTRRASFLADVAALKQALDLVDMRLLFLCNSTGYAQEVQAKLAHEERQRELARQEELLRRQRQEQRAREERERARLERERQELVRQQEAAYREETRLAAERQRLALEQIRAQAPAPTAPPVAILPAPSAPPVGVPSTVLDAIRLQQQGTMRQDATVQQHQQATTASRGSGKECFCGEEIPLGAVYRLDCPCKDSFYHQECIKKWVKDSKTCPTCRARVKLADIKKVKKSDETKLAAQPPKPQESVPVPQPQVPSQTALSVPAPTAPAQAAPAQPAAEPEECYLCMGTEGVDYTTGNCNCTVQKAACRACLQDWINRNHTCPNCRAEGATVVAVKR